jgi:magnesium-protoporphyrin IX monomethyl ester (oxidative) cyclase
MVQAGTTRASFGIRLVHPPFLSYYLPSIALTQLKSVVDQRFGADVDVQVVYASHDFARYVGVETYDEISGSGTHYYSGLSEWFFRQAVFPWLPDNTAEYLQRFYASSRPEWLPALLEKRSGVARFLDGLITKYRLHEARVVGFTSMFQETLVACSFAHLLKRRNPELLVVIGGSSCESPAGEELVSRIPDIDYAFSGPALVSFPRFIECVMAGNVEAGAGIAGVCTRRPAPAGRSTRLPMVDATGGHPAAACVGEALDINAPLPLDYDAYFQALNDNFPEYNIRAIVPYETSRGCWWGEISHCTFCGLNDATMGYRAMEPAAAASVIQSLFRYAERTAVFMCVDSILAPEHLRDVLPRLRTPLGSTLFYQLKANLREDDVKTLADAGVRQITPGIESLSTATLKLMAKGLTALQNIELLKHCLLHDVYPGWNFLVGTPGETEAVYRKYAEDLPWLVHLPPPLGLFTIAFQRFSPYFNNPERFGLKLRPIDYYEFVYPFGREALDRIAYEFTDEHPGAYKLAVARWFTTVDAQVVAWMRRWREGPQPRLFTRRRDGRTWIHDSRGPAVEEYPIADAAALVLDAFASHRSVAAAAGMLARRGVSVDRELPDLLERRLVFQEEDRFVSLVLPREVGPMSYDFRTFLTGRREPRAREIAPRTHERVSVVF